jgi:hypothetical protein
MSYMYFITVIPQTTHYPNHELRGKSMSIHNHLTRVDVLEMVFLL